MTSLATLSLNGFPLDIQTVGVELEGHWLRPAGFSVASDDEPCEWCVYDDEGDLDHYCDDCRERAAEGYESRSGDGVRRYLGLKQDGSVHLPYGLESTHINGEWASPILKDRAALERAVKTHYPDNVDYECGMHVHIGCPSEARMRYSRSYVYWELLDGMLRDLIGRGIVQDETADWLDLRLEEGRSTEDADVYCEPNYNLRDMGRYRRVNYGAYGDHGTIEIRVLPMAIYGAKEALPMIEAVLKATSRWWTDPTTWENAVSLVEAPTTMTLLPTDFIFPDTPEVEENTYEVVHEMPLTPALFTPEEHMQALEMNRGFFVDSNGHSLCRGPIAGDPAYWFHMNTWEEAIEMNNIFDSAQR